MRGRLTISSDFSYKIMAIKYVRNVMHCGLREAKDFVEGNYTFDSIAPDQHQKLGAFFGWNYMFQKDEWSNFYG